MYSILLDVSIKHMPNIAILLVMPITYKQAEPIFFNVLTSVQHTPKIFDALQKKIPFLLTNLQREPGREQRLVDTVKALIEHFNTFPGHGDYSKLVSVFEFAFCLI